MKKLDTVIHKNESHKLKIQRDLVVILYGICNFTFLQFYTGIDTTVQNNDNEISLHFKPMRLIFMNCSV